MKDDGKPLNRPIGHGSPKALLGPVPRIHLPLSVALSSSALSIEPAYDTGASVSVLSQADFNKIKYDTYVRPIRGWSCAVTAANGTFLKLTGAYLIRLFFKDKSYLFAFLISPDVTTSLFGLNLSCHYGMSFDAVNRCIYIPNKNICLLYTSPSPRDQRGSRMPSSA